MREILDKIDRLHEECAEEQESGLSDLRKNVERLEAIELAKKKLLLTLTDMQENSGRLRAALEKKEQEGRRLRDRINWDQRYTGTAVTKILDMEQDVERHIQSPQRHRPEKRTAQRQDHTRSASRDAATPTKKRTQGRDQIPGRNKSSPPHRRGHREEQEHTDGITDEDLEKEMKRLFIQVIRERAAPRGHREPRRRSSPSPCRRAGSRHRESPSRQRLRSPRRAEGFSRSYKIAVFSGLIDEKSESAARVWLLLMKNHWQKNEQLTWDEMKLIMLENLAGNAQEWAFTLLSDFRDMQDFETKFTDMFLESTRGGSHVPSLWNRKKDIKESMREFISSVNVCFMKTREPVGDSYKKRILYEGLPRVLQDQAADDLVNTEIDYGRFCQKLIRLEDREKALGESQRTQRPWRNTHAQQPWTERKVRSNTTDRKEAQQPQRDEKNRFCGKVKTSHISNLIPYTEFAGFHEQREKQRDATQRCEVQHQQTNDHVVNQLEQELVMNDSETPETEGQVTDETAITSSPPHESLRRSDRTIKLRSEAAKGILGTRQRRT